MSGASARQVARADRLLLDGCVKIVRRSDVSVRARVQSTTRRDRYYDCGWTMGAGWWCRCPSRSAMCSHLLAVRRVCATPRPARDPLALVTTLTRLPSRAELYVGGVAGNANNAPREAKPRYYSGRSFADRRPVRARPSPGPEQIALGPAADGR